MSSFNNDDYYNVIAEHIIEALQADAKLGTGGDYAIATWDAEFRDGDASVYNANELPAVAVAVDGAGAEEQNLNADTETFSASVLVITTGGRIQTVSQDVKKYAARIERVMKQQHITSKQLASVTGDIANTVADSVVVKKQAAAIGAATLAGNTLRGVASLVFSVEIDFQIVED